ncbi:MAG: filamentous hemagglutinin N-terminal domain-containing protein, partial [Candidatus Omnitrophica bacterium]|nr:filamentous hemagglutinin N-terminal domain-containing protein [Candidatus Omnitrophota bacterium]
MSHLLSLILHFALCTSSVYPLPQVDEVVSGQAQIQYPNSTTLRIEAVDGTIINYKSFSIAENESVIINLPSNNSQILNKDLGGSYSRLLGNLSCRGLFILTNEAGIYIGPKACIDVSSLILSTRDISNSHFLQGNYLFKRTLAEGVDRVLLNNGLIKVREAGSAVLIGGGIENQGTIITSLGKTTLAGGDAVELDISSDGLISVVIKEPVARAVLDYQGNPITDQIKNTGDIEVAGGVVVLKAQSAFNVFKKVINLEGTIKANRIEEKDGIVRIVADRDVRLAAKIEATKIEVGDSQGAIPQNVYIEEARLTAEKTIEVLAKDNIEISESQLIAPQINLFADYNQDGQGKVTQIGGLIQAEYLNLTPAKLLVNTDCLNIKVYNNTLEKILFTASKIEDGYITLEGEDFNLTYLTSANLSLQSTGPIEAREGVVITALGLNLTSNKFGSYSNPLNLNAKDIHLNRINGNMQILDSLGIGTSIMLRGPPEEEAHSSYLHPRGASGEQDSWGTISCNKDANLTLKAQKVILAGTEPTTLYGNITFHNFECTIPGKEIYFEAGKTYTFLGYTYIYGQPGYDGLIKLLSSEQGKPWYSYFPSLRESEDTSSLRGSTFASLSVNSATEAIPNNEIAAPASPARNDDGRDTLHASRDTHISYVAIQDAHNIGDPIKVMPSTNWGNCLNWDTDPVWDNDSGDGLWSTDLNWDTDTEPTSFDTATFNSTSTTDSTVDAGFAGTVAQLLIQTGYTGTITLERSLTVTAALAITSTATLDLNGQTLDLTGGTFSNDGTLKLIGSETLTSFTNDTDSGTVEYYGTGT